MIKLQADCKERQQYWREIVDDSVINALLHKDELRRYFETIVAIKENQITQFREQLDQVLFAARKLQTLNSHTC